MASTSELIPNSSGIHQLDKEAYPPADSDDEDSFVVLDSYGPRTLQMEVEPISTSGIEKTLNSITELVSKQSLSSGESFKEISLQQRSMVMNANSFASISGEEIQRNVDNLISENTQLKDTLAQNNVTMKVQVDKITKWQEEVQQVQESHKRKFAEMKIIIQDLKNENEKLKDELTEKNKVKEVHVVDAKTEENVILTKRNDNILQFEWEAGQKKIKEMEKALDIIINEKQNLSEKINDYKKEIAKYEEEISSLRASHDKVFSDKSIWVITESELNKELESIKLECETLKNANLNLTQSLQDANNKQNDLKQTLEENQSYLSTAQSGVVELQEALANAKQQLMASQMHITELKEQQAKESAERASNETDLQKKQDRKDQMCNDLITALRTQCDLFQKDYETERALKETILTEKNAVVDELQMLQHRNIQLIEEVDQLRGGYVPVRAEDVASAPPPVNNYTYLCPKCSFRFTNYPTLANHVEQCLKLYAHP
ncbi:NF-kappa-B essential modulator isoform X2 [Onthophagus taurus]|uniref:NF-kappa-B essential modulator isoform X2 n=1 Tax=Onthophagus taurus TaxID=166361 RepID=UPI0039BE9087